MGVQPAEACVSASSSPKATAGIAAAAAASRQTGREPPRRVNGCQQGQGGVNLGLWASVELVRSSLCRCTGPDYPVGGARQHVSPKALMGA